MPVVSTCPWYFFLKRHQNGLNYQFKHKNWGSNFNVKHKKLCIFLYNFMETTGVCQGKGTMHSNVMNTVFCSGDAWDCHSMPINWALKNPEFFIQNELNFVLCYMYVIWDLLVTFRWHWVYNLTSCLVSKKWLFWYYTWTCNFSAIKDRGFSQKKSQKWKCIKWNFKRYWFL